MSRNVVRALTVGFATAVTLACGGGSPTSPGAAANRNPAIANLNVTPSFVVSGLTPVALTASATDADGDTLTYTWTIGNTTLTGQTASLTPSGDGALTVRLTVNDGRGGAATDTRVMTIGTMTGVWSLALSPCTQQGALPTLTLTQTGTAVAGTFAQSAAYCNGQPGMTGMLDPGEPATLDAQGTFNARVKIANFIDIRLVDGKMDATGRKVTGRLQESGFSVGTDTFTMTKQ